jgi:hypothetical protein
VSSQPGQMVFEILFQKNPITQKGCLEWPKVQALSSNPSSAKTKPKTTKKKKKKTTKGPVAWLK